MNFESSIHKRIIFLKIGISILSLLIVLGLAEFLTRTLSPHPRYPEFMIADERVGFLPKPNYRGRATNMFGEFDTEIRTNQEGFRDSNHPLKKSKDSLRIAFLGDSFTFAEQVEEKETFVRRIENLIREKLKLNSKSSPKVECMNFGVGGYDTYQEALCYEEFVRKYHPDFVVLVMYVHNDLIGNVFYLTETGFGRPYFRLTNGELQKVPADLKQLVENQRNEDRRFKNVRWYHHSHFYNLIRQALWDFRQKQKLKDLAKNFQREHRDAKLNQDLWQQDLYRNYRYYVCREGDFVVREADEVTHLLLKRLAERVQKDGAQFCIALLPSQMNLWPEQWPEQVKLLPGLERFKMDFDRPFRQIQAFVPEIAARGSLLDLRRPLREASATESVFFRRDSHYNLRGQEAVARVMADWFGPKLLK